MPTEWENVRKMAAAAQGRFRLIGTISVAFGCPFEGAVDPDVVVADAIRFGEMGVDHVALGDTTGMATPAAMKGLVGRLRHEAPALALIAHLHDTRGTGLVNALAAYEAGVRRFRLLVRRRRRPSRAARVWWWRHRQCLHRGSVNLFELLGIHTGLDLAGLIETSRLCEQTLGREFDGRVTRSGSIRCCGNRADRTSKKPWQIWAHSFRRRHTGTDRFR